ncbi:hypothetical protein C8Q75DRAFT_731406 [Abortiporus biennis]|nr:hypothetical protein C8Q75DRAFT_731406 [Abortiporus biennis]
MTTSGVQSKFERCAGTSTGFYFFKIRSQGRLGEYSNIVLATGVFNSLPQIPSIAVVTYVMFFYLLFLTHVHLAIKTIILTADPIDFRGHIRDSRIHFRTEPRMSGAGDDDRWPFDFRILLETALHVQEFSLKTGRQCNF